jgi:hypothetical protein
MLGDAMGDDTENDDVGEDSPSVRQWLHAATGDRDAEAQALADRSGEEVSVDDAKVAVQKAHGESVSGNTDREHDLASAEDAQDVADEHPASS